YNQIRNYSITCIAISGRDIELSDQMSLKGVFFVPPSSLLRLQPHFKQRQGNNRRRRYEQDH
ncbi:hypothetical protein, partial [Daejeonella sp.]|uniref:hypothetical protein n=1 Tax=Daejeonella sp. TaxID=2805397 RepID=UPI0030BBA613